ncbi:hypothetical protein ACFQFC_40400 [Amorphoplanes digitatis]|uniref:Uncharacterized protein n=1 Tax=Actinoplanes digitatis TaxID=1868 RepID=A0A7W7HXB3_9ACTN|nr:hypothetical protein [Actinoplanes digitatis]MBB4762435.1 hypothetical protein [Actinoplanes digitatis]BFE71262.1 hypothetical protein GCM10020092_045630 [Actinoplanes digitatis]GID92441.1 hypothetical protein Adi01nite_18530 [Actinoplanes digitatis]
MTDEEIAERIRRARRCDQAPSTIGGHPVLIDTIRLPAGTLTTARRVRDGRITMLRASAGSFREDVARALLDVHPVAPGTVRPIPIDVPGLRLDRALVLGPGEDPELDPELDERTVTVVAVHHSEILPGEAERDLRRAISPHGTGLAHRLDDWNRHPVPRADARLLDDWPGGAIRRSERLHPWQAERILARVAPEGPAEVRVEIRAMDGHALVLQRRWDRGVGTLTYPDGTTAPVDLPRHDLWARLAPIFLGESLDDLVTVSPGTPETDVLELRYQTLDRGSASLPVLETLDRCTARLDRQILRTPGNWAVFTSRSDAVIQVECTEEGRLWLETPDPSTKRSHGLHVTVQQATTLLEILSREDRSAVTDLPDAETITWD